MEQLGADLELLRRSDLPRALQEARRLVNNPATGASVLAACINVLATYLDTLLDQEFAVQLPTVLDWIERFQSAPGIETDSSYLASQAGSTRAWL